jgi:signal transduction histidine kinase
MPSIRAKITTAYAGLLLGTSLAFAGTVYVARRANVYNELAESAAAYGDVALAMIRQAGAAGGRIIVSSDSLYGTVLEPKLQTLLDAVPGYFLVKDHVGRTLYTSVAVRALPDSDQADVRDAAAKFDSLARSGRKTTVGLQIDLTRDRIFMIERRPESPNSPISHVAVAVSMSAVDTQRRELLGTLLVVAPFILGISIVGAHIIAGRAFQPVDRIINEVEAITDGRSLHKRLAVEATGDELARLTATLNAMIGRLETSFGALRRFTADASHELKTPLAVLRADVERAMHTHPGSNDQLVALEEALHETTRMADLVDSLLTLARADEGRFDILNEPFQLEPLVREVFETAVILGEHAGLNVTMPVVQDATVLGDRTRLRHLFLNLVTNAIKYTSRGGTVEVTLAVRGDTVSFAVRDTGIGIAAADLPYIFERFWRADRARSRASERGGFGLGLAISQWIAHAHGGTLTVVSRLNRGSTFTVTLPIARPGEVVAEAAD